MSFVTTIGANYNIIKICGGEYGIKFASGKKMDKDYIHTIPHTAP